MLSRCGSLLIAHRRYTEALDVYERAHKILSAGYQADPSDPILGTELIVDLEAIGRVAFERCSEILFHLGETGHLDDQGANWLHEADMQLRQPF